MQRRIPKKCSVSGCEKDVYSKGLCKWHYWRDCKEKESKKKGNKIHRKVYRKSSKRQKQDKRYSILRRDFLEKFPFCEVQLPGCTLVAGEIHHKQGRLGDKYLDVTTWVAICHNCHQKIHGSHTAWAYENNFLKSRLKNNNMPKEAEVTAPDIKVKKTPDGNRYVEGVISIKLRVLLEKGDERDEIPEDEAFNLLNEEQEHLAGSNDGSEILANTKVELVK